MSHLYDRKNLRPLTLPELWASWDLMIDHPDREVKLLQGTLGKDSLPREALNEENGRLGGKPLQFPVIRTDCDLQYNHTLIEYHNNRSFRLHVIRDILVLPHQIYIHVTLPMRKAAYKKIWEKYRTGDWEDHPLDEKLVLFEIVKERANRAHKAGNYVEALNGYATAWTHLLPWHLDAFPAGSDIRSVLAKRECQIFNNIMATILEMIKANKVAAHTGTELELLNIGHRAGMSILGICFGIKVGSLQTALRRIAQIKSKIDDLDKSKTLPPIKKDLRKLHDGLVKYCKNRDPDENLFHFDYKASSLKDQIDIMMEDFHF